jgi:hypothetical protein
MAGPEDPFLVGQQILQQGKRSGAVPALPGPAGDVGGGEEHIRTPYRGRNKPASQKDANRAHARLRAPGERANAQLKSWRILRKLRCCPWRAGQLAKAIHVLQTREIGG